MANARMRLGFVQHAVLVLTFSVQSLPQSLAKVLRHFCISGAFCYFTQVQPLPSPHKQGWTRAPRILSEFQLCIGGRENCKKISKTMHCFMREPRNYRTMWILHYCPIRTFVHDCRLDFCCYQKSCRCSWLTGEKYKQARVPDITFQVPHGQPVESIHSTAVISAASVKLNCNLPDSLE